METAVRLLAAAVLLAALAAAPAFAKDDARISAAQHDMNAAYAALLGTLSGAAKLHLERDQERWLANRRACDENAGRKDGCLESRYQTRTAKLKLFADGPYPFIGEQAIVKSGTLKHGTYTIDVSYPQFDSTAADFSAVNGSFADLARQSIDDVLQSEFVAGYEQTFDLYRLSADVVSVWIHSEMWQANFHVSNTGTLVNLRTGHVIPPEDVFKPGAEWRVQLLALVEAEVTKDFRDMSRGQKPADLREILNRVQPADYLFEDDELVLYLPEVALSLGMRGYAVEIRYSALKPLLRADGPLGGR
jgi:uncharacterized protein